MAQWMQVTRPVATTSITDDGADGARLRNFYASATVIPQESVVPLILRKVPGFSDGYDPNSVSSRTSNKPQRMIFSVDSAIYGNHLFVVSEDHLVVYQNTGQDDISETDEYYWHDMPTGFTASADKPRRWATDGRYVMIISADEVWCFDRKKIEEDVARDEANRRQTGNTIWVNVVAPTSDDTSEETKTEDWVDVVWSDGYFILGNRAGQVWNSNLASLTFDQLDFARADINPDKVVGLAIHESKLYALGSKTIEIWVNYGGTRFAFSRDRQFSINVGCYSRETIQTNEEGIYFVGDDLKVYRVSSGQLQPISNDAVHETLRKAVNDPAINPTLTSFLYTEEGHKFYCLHVGIDLDDNDNVVNRYYWCYDDATGAWHERSTIDGEALNAPENYIVMIANYKEKNWVVTEGYEYTKVRQMGLDHAKGINGNTIKQECVLPVIEGERRRVNHYNIQAIFDFKKEGNDDEIIVDLAWNDKRDTERTINWKERTGRRGQPLARVKWNRLGQAPGSGRNYRFTIADEKPKINMLGVYLDADVLVN